MAKNADSALKLGQARGSAIVAAVNAELPVYEYAARLVKQAVVGTGAADKSQVQHMVQQMLKLPGKAPSRCSRCFGGGNLSCQYQQNADCTCWSGNERP